MRIIDRRGQVNRRDFLKTGAAAPVAAAVLGAGFTADAAWAQGAKNLSPHQMATIAKAARDIFPHDFLADKYYIVAVTPYDAASSDEAKKALWTGGVARLDSEAADRFKAANYLALNWEADRVAILRAVEQTPKFGYEGSSAEHGGYIARGFDDIDWLPTA